MKTLNSKTPNRVQPGVGFMRTPLAPIRTPLSARNVRTPAPKRLVNKEEKVKDPVEVFCRVRPGEGDAGCLEVLTDTTVQLAPPTTSKAFNTGKEVQCSFKHVFKEDSTQAAVFDRVGLPLVSDVVQGKNGLLFTYGVTGSGKTHTMQGTSKDGGIMTRAIDVIFNSVSELQTRKFQLKPDKNNGFDIMSDSDAALERQEDLANNIKTPGRRRGATSNTSGEANLSNRVMDTQKVPVDEDMQYAVFVSYVEIYNNYTYDLLDQPKMDFVTGRQKLASKILREDSSRNMYVHGVTEVEVKSPEEALEAFNRGQKQRSVSATILNLQSSRSHSIFNIRVVSAPLDPLGEDILADSSALVVGQLALVDLAGSERTNRTGNTGQRLQEASKINQSLMTLRSCIEVLRDNQSSGTSKAVPYRDSRVTHLFRNYFEGEGKVKMVVCVNPRPTDYEENVNVMQFAELTQEVQIERAVGVRFDLGLTPGRRRANQVYKEAVKRMEEQGEEVEHLVMDLAPVYSLGPTWPPMDITQYDDEDIIERLRTFLMKRISTRKALLKDQENRQSKFRELLINQEKENVMLKAETKQLRAQLEVERKKVSSLEQKVVVLESENKSLNTKVAAYSDMKEVLENELDEKEMELNAEQRDKLKTKAKYKAKIVMEREKVASELAGKFIDREKEIKQEHGKTVAKLHALKNLINDDLTSTTSSEAEHPDPRNAISDPNITALHADSPKRKRNYQEFRGIEERIVDLENRGLEGGTTPTRDRARQRKRFKVTL